LEECIKQGITRDPEFGQGNGLFGSFQISALSGGTFHINSGFAHLVSSRSGAVSVRRDALEFLGTAIVCSVNYAKPAVLEKAMKFEGYTSTMVDFIEMNYEESDDILRIYLRDEAESLGSRRSGFSVRRKLKNLLEMSAESCLVCDLSDIGIMSSSFADEVFGKLALEYRYGKFQRRVKLQGA
jgi:hypothetical protein